MGDLYEILGISKDANADAIKKAYRKLALKYHPDRNQGDKDAEEKFKEITAAYEILSDPQKRSAYDRYGMDAFSNGAGAGFGGFDGFDLHDIFSSFFGEGFGGGFAQSTYEDELQEDVHATLELDFLEAIKGCNKSFAYSYKCACSDCAGTKSASKQTHKCEHCNGRGRVSVQTGIMRVVQTCPYCKGAGTVIKDKCKTCAGSGYKLKQTNLEIDVPAGVDNGYILKIANCGNELADGSRANLAVHIKVRLHETFVRKGMDVFIDVPILFTQAALGAKISVPGIWQNECLNVPAGVADKSLLKIAGAGVKTQNRSGDMYVQISIKYPKHLSDEQRDLLVKLNESFGIHDQELATEQHGLFAKLKNLFK